MEFNNTMLKVIINEVSKLHRKSDELNLVLDGIPCGINDFSQSINYSVQVNT